ncbi:MAG: hypothetical protein MPJ78_10560 [Hyphomicrobiaceae bacterium]|nr:hypothetical protein [Hyphomicrobiaceae bacterium]
MGKSDAVGASDVTLGGAVKRKGWQRVLMYPAVLGALIGAVPTGLDYYKAFVYDIDFQHVKHAEEQRRLWVKNFACAQNISYQQVKTEKNIVVQVGACANGDVLIEVAPPRGNRILEWISLERLQTASAVSGLSFIGRANAAIGVHATGKQGSPGMTRIAQGGTSIKCQKMHGQNKIVRIVQEGNKCFREEISVMKGAVLSRKPVSCSSSCG